MDKCPPELHAYICQLTCVDDGNTIRSINKVSRYFYNISKPYLYQNLSISGPEQIHAVATVLETKSKGYLRHIRHLFIHDTTSTIEQHGHSHETESAIQATPETHTLILRIISLAAPTLESLAFIAYSPQTSTSLIARLFKTSFPRLRDLSICGFYPFPTTAGKFPQLERLHLSGNRNPHGLLQMSVLESACPSLKLLKISGLVSAASFVMEVKEAVENVDNDGEGSMSLFPAKFPPRVCRVILQAGPSPKVATGGKEGYIQHRDRLMMKDLEDLNIETTTNLNVVQVTVLDRSPQPMTVRDIKEEWLENISTFIS
ncbi:hypothetical protein BYT27DRAFT_7195968 [Phlegmacium glaucopus]|nr:hypothetical protein BYT27DRAFT_7195968 [Phlegmacium glaucopus]